jgi:hypothetical protein
MPFGLLSSITSSSNLLSMSPCNPIIIKNNGGCGKQLENVARKIKNGVFWQKMQLHRMIKCWNGCHFSGCGKFNRLIKISFVIIYFGLHKKKF